jgi:toxin ParE1/3/4
VSRYHLSDRARDDLDEIWLYIADDSPATADCFVDEIIARFRDLADLAEQPGMGRTREELAPSLRSVPVGNYLIFYRAHSDGIDIVRVLSGFRDLPGLFAIE